MSAMADTASFFLSLRRTMQKTNTPGFVWLLIPTLLLLLLSSLFFLFHFYFPSKSSKEPRKAPLPPGPKPWPIIGCLPTMLRNKPAFRWILATMKDKDIGCIKLGNTYVIPVNCPAISREFLKKNDAIFASRPLTMATEYSGRGFLSVVISPWGEQWKKMRRVMASEVISPTRLRLQSNLRVEEADNLVRYIYNQCNDSEQGFEIGAVIDVRLALRQYCGNIIRRMLFNRRYFGDGDKNGGPGMEELEYIEAAFSVLSLIYASCVSDYMPYLRWLDLDGHEKIMKKAIAVLNKYHDPIIEDRMEKWRGRGDGFPQKEPEDLVDVFISLKDSKGKPLLNMEEIKAQSAELIFATVDSPSNLAEWALAEILNQPHILHKAVEELDRVVGKERLVQESDFSQLPYIKACAREALRLHPVAPFNLPHVSSSDATIAGYFIPKGSHVLLSRVGLGRNPKIWNDPLKFDPERHLEDGSTQVDLAEPDLRFISFTAGRRGCMGGQLGSVMSYMMLARLLQGFSWSLPPGSSYIDLSEEKKSLFMAKPLHMIAKPRLPIQEHV